MSSTPLQTRIPPLPEYRYGTGNTGSSIPPLSLVDKFGTLKVRLGIGRMNYTVPPGLYTHGTPTNSSPVLVTANYKLSFDTVRQAIRGLDLWVLVLDTNGINVWCAAGKGTFGTDELTKRIELCALHDKVSHRILILPQLGAPGIAAHLVTKTTDFKVIYGPVNCRDIPKFLADSLQANKSMRRKTFSLGERAVLIPVELRGAFSATTLLVIVLSLLAAMGGDASYFSNLQARLPLSCATGFIGMAGGTVLTPLLLPYLPGRAFALKGFWAGLLGALLFFLFFPAGSDKISLQSISSLVIICTLSAYWAMIFTGASTYTSLSGVKKEMRLALPPIIIAGGSGIIAWTLSAFLM
ncbi:MAG: mercury methylation corrinoid protein HgcA [Desulfobulbaceae bacterium]|nr:mercury methylation corrinoid protein HgcA [Desulfobulbaceae bacterium]